MFEIDLTEHVEKMTQILHRCEVTLNSINILKCSAIYIYFDDFCNCFYVSVLKLGSTLADNIKTLLQTCLHVKSKVPCFAV